jgi:hypothetical protein
MDHEITVDDKLYWLLGKGRPAAHSRRASYAVATADEATVDPSVGGTRYIDDIALVVGTRGMAPSS